jgi:fatty-acyl-CoA synthase
MAKANAALPAADRLAHLVVTQYTDAFDPSDSGDGAPPAAWRDWLLTRHPLPALEGGQAHAWTDALANDLPLPELAVGPADLAVLPYTSGTTGLPKGCMHPHRSMMHNAMASAAWGNGTADNVALLVVPMFHITGMVSVLHTNIYWAPPRADAALGPRTGRPPDLAVEGHHWTNIPTMVIDLMGSPNFDQYDLSGLVYIGGGGAAMPQAVAQRLLEQFGLRYVEGYGLTETAAPSHSNPPTIPSSSAWASRS